MSAGFYLVKQGGSGELIEKKSRFIANVYAIEGEEDAKRILDTLRKKYWDARHNCYAFVAGDHDELQRCSDDGEPSGTAGKPILEMITGRRLHNCMIVVTRYFGGTLLGTGGLVRAYQGAARAGLQESVIVERIGGNAVDIVTDYQSLEKINYSAAQLGITIENVEYTEVITIHVVVEDDKCDRLVNTVTEITGGRARITAVPGKWLYKDCSEEVL